MGVQVAFNYAVWVAQFTQFNTAPGQAAVEALVPIAEIYNRNDGGGPVSTAATQTALLNLMVAHIVQLVYGPNGNNPSGLVGRIASATEGSVSVSSEWPVTQENAWFLQTPFGASWWQATAAYRTMTYMPGPRRFFNPPFAPVSGGIN